MPQIVTTHELRTDLGRILLALAQGEQFLLVKDSQMLAQIIPLRDQLVSQPAICSPTPVPDVREMISLLGEHAVSRIVGLTWLTFAQQCASNSFTTPVHDRLTALSAALAEQNAFLPRYRIQTWWRRPHRALSGHSPIEYLALPWTADDMRSSAVFQLIHQQHLLQKQ